MSVGLAWKSAKATGRVFWRAARQLFHEVVGAMFAIFALYGLLAAWRAWEYAHVRALATLAVLYSFLMMLFSLASFHAARRVR